MFSGVGLLSALAVSAPVFVIRTQWAKIVFQNELNTSLPPHIEIVNYYGEALVMDPSCFWELRPVDDSFLKELVTNAALTRVDAEVDPVHAGYSVPKWWNREQIERLPECYNVYRGGERRVWVDREQNRLYVEVIGA